MTHQGHDLVSRITFLSEPRAEGVAHGVECKQDFPDCCAHRNLPLFVGLCSSADDVAFEIHVRAAQVEDLRRRSQARSDADDHDGTDVGQRARQHAHQPRLLRVGEVPATSLPQGEALNLLHGLRSALSKSSALL